MISEHQRHISGEQMHAGSVRLLRDRARRLHDRRHRPRRVRHHPRRAQGIIIISLLLFSLLLLVSLLLLLLKDPIKDTMGEYGSDDTITAAWDDIQTEYQCCGVDGPDDWEMANVTPLPDR